MRIWNDRKNLFFMKNKGPIKGHMIPLELILYSILFPPSPLHLHKPLNQTHPFSDSFNLHHLLALLKAFKSHGPKSNTSQIQTSLTLSSFYFFLTIHWFSAFLFSRYFHFPFCPSSYLHFLSLSRCFLPRFLSAFPQKLLASPSFCSCASGMQEIILVSFYFPLLVLPFSVSY